VSNVLERCKKDVIFLSSADLEQRAINKIQVGILVDLLCSATLLEQYFSADE
jgi:hypothetical protein